MACDGVHCTNQCLSNVCNYTAGVVGYDYTGPGGEPFPDSQGDRIYDENLLKLGNSINDERARRNAHTLYPSYSPFSFDVITGSEDDPPDGGDLIFGDTNGFAEMMEDMKTAINEISSVVTYTTTPGNPLPWTSIRQARNKINTLKAECLCDTNCGENITCGCDNDCGTNYYSDERLKRDIRSL